MGGGWTLLKQEIPMLQISYFWTPMGINKGVMYFNI